MEWIDSDIGEPGTTMISEALKCNSVLTQLYLIGNEWRRED